LIEREVLLAAAPHIVWPMRFVLPHSPEQRPAWLVRLGLFLYDHLGGRERLPPTRSLDLRTAPEGEPLKPEFRRGFEYSDCWVDDARLVVLSALDARERGATILTRTACTEARRAGGLWHLVLRDQTTGRSSELQARVLVNAAGPWVSDVISRVADLSSPRRVRLVKGSHIVVPKFWEGPQAYLVQNDDKRVIFVNPYEDELCLIGTTDIPWSGAAEDVAIGADEIDYLIGAVNRYFRRQLAARDILHSFSGVRPLYDDNALNPSAVTRDYLFDLDAPAGAAPLLSVFGGKITTFRKLAEHALDRLMPFFPGLRPGWTAAAPLPGGDMPDADFAAFLRKAEGRYPGLPPRLVRHYARLYGTRMDVLLSGVSALADLGRHFGADFYEREARYLIRAEWAQTAEDILERRTKHGLHLTEEQRTCFERWLAGDAVAAAAAAS
jgi:glycerol-3-phosphate dehydrogenase